MKRQFFVDHGSAMSHNLDNWKARGNKRVRTGWAVFFLCLTLVAPSTCLADSQNRFPGKGDKSAWERANVLAREGIVLGRTPNQLDAAIQKVKAAIALYPFDSTYYYNLGNYYSDKKAFNEAVEQYSKAVSLEPQDVDSLFNLGLAYRGLKDNQKAEQSYRRALTIRSNDFDILYNLGNCLRDQRRYAEAKVMYEKAGRAPGADAKAMRDAYRMLNERVAKDGGAIR